MSTMPLQQAIAVSQSVLANVTPDQLDLPTPCASWKVSDLINHMVGAHQFFAAALAGQPPSAPTTDYSAGDFVAAFDESAAADLAAFSADGVMGTMYKLPFGEMPGVAFAGLAATDTFTHAWDLAKATGQSTDLAPALAEGLLAAARMSIPEAFRGPDGKAPFGSVADAPAGATNADQLAAFLGRAV